MEEARPAALDDLPRLEEILQRAISTTPQIRGGWLFGHQGRSSTPVHRLGEAIGDDRRLVLAGLIDDYVVGICIASIDVETPETMGVIEELYVEPEARSVGVGEALLDTAVMWCRKQGCKGVDLAALPGDRAAKNLCERSGFRARLLVMHHNLGNEITVELDD